jgi:hypothetical protein
VEWEVQWTHNKWSALGSVALMQGESDEGVSNPKHSPELLVKLGGVYQLLPNLEASLFEKYLDAGSPVHNDVPNDPVENVHLLSAKLAYDFGKELGFEKIQSIRLELTGDNLLDEEVNIPEFVIQEINAIPGRAGRTYFLNLVATF